MSKIVQGSIQPMQAGKLHLDRLAVPLVLPDVHVVKLVSERPLVVAPESLDHAAACAERVIARMRTLPHTTEAGDLLAMAYAILHYAGKKE